MKKKRVLILIRSVSRKNGGASSALDLIEAIDLLGFEVEIGVSQFPPIFFKLFRRNLGQIPLNKLRIINPNLLVWNTTKLRKIILKLFYYISIKKINYSRFKKYDIVIDASELNVYALENIKKINPNASLVRNHAGSVSTILYNLKKYHKDVNKAYVKKFFLYDYILFQSKMQAEECSRKFKKLLKKPLVLRPSCQENVVLRAQNEPSPYKGSKLKVRIVNVGSIQPRKAQLLSVEIINRIVNKLKYSNVELHFVGGIVDSNYKIKIDEFVNNHQINDKVKFHGHCDNYLAYMANADLILQTSKHEGVSRILREAMLLNKPIASFSISGTSELLDSESAILSKPFNVEELSYKIFDYLTNRQQQIYIPMNANNKYLLNNSKAVYLKSLNMLINKISC